MVQLGYHSVDNSTLPQRPRSNRKWNVAEERVRVVKKRPFEEGRKGAEATYLKWRRAPDIPFLWIRRSSGLIHGLGIRSK